MQVIRSTLEAEGIADIAIRRLILERIQGIADDLPFDSHVHGFFVIVEAGDTLEAINANLGFDLLTRQVEIAQDCGTCWDLLLIMDDSGFGIELFLPKVDGMSVELLELCRRHAAKDQS